jgi:hypothetical protein
VTMAAGDSSSGLDGFSSGSLSKSYAGALPCFRAQRQFECSSGGRQRSGQSTVYRCRLCRPLFVREQFIALQASDLSPIHADGALNVRKLDVCPEFEFEHYDRVAVCIIRKKAPCGAGLGEFGYTGIRGPSIVGSIRSRIPCKKAVQHAEQI